MSITSTACAVLIAFTFSASKEGYNKDIVLYCIGLHCIVHNNMYD